MTLLDDLDQRGLLHQVTDRDGLAKLLASKVVPVYAGYDPTSPSLHVGNLVPTILLKRFQLAGHRPIVVVGGATGMIGDPSGKSDERNLLDEDTLRANVAGCHAQLSRLLDFTDPVKGAAIVNNYDWTRDVTYLTFLREYGKHLTINYMMAKDSVRNRAGTDTAAATLLVDASGTIRAVDDGTLDLLRAKPEQLVGKPFAELIAAKDRERTAAVLETVRTGLGEGGTQRGGGSASLELGATRPDLQEVACTVTVTGLATGDLVVGMRERQAGISYTEFSYMLLQGFDFVKLAQSHGCRLQVGGSDQYGNITAGCELSHKTGGPQLFGLTAPLLLDSSGQKMGKTATGEKIWLDAARTSPFDFYQYWLRRDDTEAPRLLRMFSLQSLAEIDEILARHDADRSKRTAQRELARAMTTWVHGSDPIGPIEAASKLVYGSSLANVTAAELQDASRTLPTIDIPRDDLATGVSIVDLLAKTGISKSEANRRITNKGVFVNHVQVTDAKLRITTTDLVSEAMLVLRSSKKDIHLVRPV